MRRKAYVILSGMIGAVTLCAFSVFQKFLIGAPMIPKGFIVPVVFGFISGAGVGFWHARTLSLTRKLEHETRKRYSEVQEILNVVPLGVAEIDANGMFLFNNKNYSGILGYEENELAGKYIYDLQKDPAEAEKLRAYIELLRKERPEPTPWTGINLDKHGNPVHVEVYWGYKLDRNGDVTGFITTVMDITKRKIAERAFRESERRFTQLLENVDNVAVQGYDEERRVIFWNSASENLYGYTAAEATGGRLEDLIMPENMRSEAVRLIRQWYEEGIPIPAGELELMSKNGQPVPVHSSHVMQKGPDGRREMYCIDVDLYEIKKANEDLLQAKEQAEAANIAKSEFLANMSHELRTPLNGIMGMLQLMRTTSLDVEQNEYLSVAVQSAKRLTNLVGDILDLSKVEAGKMEIVNGPFDLRETLVLAEQLFRPSCEQRGIRLSFRVDPNIPPILLGDNARLLQIINNLLGNAVKFTEKGAISIEAWSVSKPEEDAKRILFTVSDTGIGIDEADFDNLFEGFTQADASYKRKYQGAGLGLSIVKRLVSLMGGSMSVSSELGVGTTFNICLEFGIDNGTVEQHENEMEASFSAMSGLKVLLVEDDYVNRVALEKLLSKYGFTTEIAEDGKQALDKLGPSDFDLVLMDVQMPVMDGVEAVRAIRNGDAGKGKADIPVIALTAHAMAGDKEKFISAGMDGYLPKPLDERDLMKELARVMRSTDMKRN